MPNCNEIDDTKRKCALALDFTQFPCTLFITMKNITLSVDETIIQQARRRAAAENTTINELVRTWLERYVTQPAAPDLYDEMMATLGHVQAGRKFTREEMNERR